MDARRIRAAIGTALLCCGSLAPPAHLALWITCGHALPTTYLSATPLVLWGSLCLVVIGSCTRWPASPLQVIVPMAVVASEVIGYMALIWCALEWSGFSGIQ